MHRFLLLLALGLMSFSKGQCCAVRTDQNRCCVFPFVYQGNTYTSCSPGNHSRPWCSYTRDYDKDKRWGVCVANFTTVPAEPTVTVDEHAPLQLYCNATANVTWLKFDVKNRVVEMYTGAHLRFRNITRKDAGSYICNATTGNITLQSIIIQIDVQYRPEIVSISSNKTIVEGQHSLHLTCNSTGSPVPMVTWRLPSGQARPGSLLAISDVTRSKRGKYICSATNALGNDTRTTYVDVQYRPTVNKSSALQVVHSWLHQNVTLTCPASGNPSPRITWYKDGSMLPALERQPLVTVSLTSPSRFGNYTCRASNFLGMVDHHVWIKRTRFPPSTPQITNNLTDLPTSRLTLAWSQPYDGGSRIIYYTIWSRSIYPNGSVTTWTSLNKTQAREYIIILPREEKWGIAVSATNGQGHSGLGPSKNFSVVITYRRPQKEILDYRLIAYSCVGVLLFIIFIVIVIVIVKCKRRKPRPVRKPESGLGKDSMMVELKKKVKQDRYSVIVRPRSESFREESPQVYQAPSDDFHEGEVYANVNPAYLRNHGDDLEIPRDAVKIEKVIGKGAFCKVAKAFVAGLGTVAVKMVKAKGGETSRRDLLAEYKLLTKISYHDNVIRIMGAVTLTDPIMIMFEYVPYGDLLGYLRKSRGLTDSYYNDPDVEPASFLAPKQLLRFARETADGMSFLAQNKIIHRDLAARNVLVGQGETCKITDFGMARDVINDDIYQKRSKGRLPVKWTAYESLLYGFYTTQSDVWSFGIVLYEIFTIGGSPYPNQNPRHIAQLIQAGYRMPQPKHVDNEIYALMMECWTTEPELRPTFEAISSTLRRLEATEKEVIYVNQYDESLYANMDEIWDEQ